MVLTFERVWAALVVSTWDVVFSSEMSDGVITSFRRAVFAVSNHKACAGEIAPRPQSPMNKNRSNLKETPDFFRATSQHNKNTTGPLLMQLCSPLKKYLSVRSHELLPRKC